MTVLHTENVRYHTWLACLVSSPSILGTSVFVGFFFGVETAFLFGGEGRGGLPSGASRGELSFNEGTSAAACM